MKGRYIFFAVITIILPFVLAMGSVMLVFTPEFLQFEYRQPDFPEDPFGFTLEERMEYGTASVDYITGILNRDPDAFLESLKMKDGSPLYNERELSHMKDVRIVFQGCRAGMAAMIVFIILTIWLVSKRPDSLMGLLHGIGRGSALTLILIAAVGIGIVTGFDAFFDSFHQLFFNDGTWLFYESDSLIRLFPEKLWVDGFSLAAIFTGLMAFLLLLVSILAGKKVKIIQKKTGYRE